MDVAMPNALSGVVTYVCPIPFPKELVPTTGAFRFEASAAAKSSVQLALPLSSIIT